jgi:hypothetical protein
MSRTWTIEDYDPYRDVVDIPDHEDAAPVVEAS